MEVINEVAGIIGEYIRNNHDVWVINERIKEKRYCEIRVLRVFGHVYFQHNYEHLSKGFVRYYFCV